MAIELGYNIGKSEELITSICNRYKALGMYIDSQWQHVQPILRREWIGPDEISYEARLVARINKMYSKSRDLAQAAVTTVVNLTNSWIDFQHSNVIKNEGQETATVTFVTGLKHIEDPGLLPKPDVLVTAITWDGGIEFTNEDDLGLRTTTSKNTILSTVDRFVKAVQSRATETFDEITLNNAFFGSQQSSLKKYIEAVGIAIGEVTTSFKELGDALEQLANTNYTGADSTVNESFTTETSNINSSVETELTNRWTSSN